MEEQVQQKKVIPLTLGQKTSVFAGSAATLLGLEVLAHAPVPLEVAAVVGALCLAKKSPEIYTALRGQMTFLPDLSAQEQALIQRAQAGDWTFFDRLLGRHYNNAKPAQPKQDRNVDQVTRQENSFDFDSDDDDITLPTQKKNDGVFRFSELLASGWRPSVHKIFVGRTPEGKDIFVAAEDLCHVALAGKTGGGKGSLMRLLMVQLCYVGAKVLLLNPHYMRWVKAKDGEAFDEDWTPFEGLRKPERPYLVHPPIDCAKYETIGEYLEWAVRTELVRRIEEGRDSDKKFKPFFIVVDEWPAIVGELRDASSRLGKLLREGRKYGLFVIIASQDFQVKTLGIDGSGSVRKCFLTVYYTGGDPTTSRELLSEPDIKINENEIGKGVVYLKCASTKNKPVLALVPFVDNASVYCLLGPSTFKKAATTQKNEVEIVEPRIDWTDDGVDEPVTQKPKQEITLTLEQLLAIQGRLPVRNTDDLPEETQVIRSPYYEQTGQHLYWQQPTQVQPSPYQTVPDLSTYREQTVTSYPATRRSSTALSPLLQKARDAYQRGFTTSREMAPEINVGKTKAAELIKQLRERRLID